MLPEMDRPNKFMLAMETFVFNVQQIHCVKSMLYTINLTALNEQGICMHLYFVLALKELVCFNPQFYC